MTPNEQLELAIAVAVEAHAGQCDKQGEPYILHALRVMLAMPYAWGRAVAVLHDVVEDTPLSLDDLYERGLPADVVEVVNVLTRADSQRYEDYIARVAQNPLAARVKIADLRDNLNWRRVSRMSDDGVADFFDRLLPRYTRALAVLAPSSPLS